MEFIDTDFDGLLLIKPSIFKDKRGLFFEAFNKRILDEIAPGYNFVQDNISLSAKNVLRGLHFQNEPYAQGKIVSVIKGAVLDVVVDLRKQSSNFGKHFVVELNESNRMMMLIPPGFAHGFLSLFNDTTFHYKCSDYYKPAHDTGILWSDSDLSIDWGIKNPSLSEKDSNLMSWKDFIKVTAIS
jgi:dTDP-4-dehydrorhamnose 3,5-epimerase